MTGQQDAADSNAGVAADAQATEASQHDDLPAEDVDTDDVDSLRAALDEARATAQENWDKLLRATAETENVRRRATRDVENARKYGIERFASDLLEVADSMEAGITAAEAASADSLLDGMRATLKLFLGGLERHGIECVDPEGEPFDPQLHEAMSMQPSDTAEPGSVLLVVQKGYSLNGRLLRPARVIVAAE